MFSNDLVEVAGASNRWINPTFGLLASFPWHFFVSCKEALCGAVTWVFLEMQCLELLAVVASGDRPLGMAVGKRSTYKLSGCEQCCAASIRLLPCSLSMMQTTSVCIAVALSDGASSSVPWP